jgi:hypothetical protein
MTYGYPQNLWISMWMIWACVAWKSVNPMTLAHWSFFHHAISVYYNNDLRDPAEAQHAD